MDIPNEARWIFAAAAAILVIASVVGGGLEIRDIHIPELRGLPRVFAGIVGVAFIVPVIWTQPAQNDPPDNDSPTPTSVTVSSNLPNADITSPQNGADVPYEFSVTGEIDSQVQSGKRLWLVMEDSEGDHYPQGAFSPTADGRFDRPVGLGDNWREKKAIVWIVQVSTDTALGDILVRADQSGADRINMFELGIEIDSIASVPVFVTGP